MAAEIGNTHIVSGYGFARKDMMSFIALGKKRAGYCFENIRQQVEKCSRREFTETSLKKDVLSIFVEARNRSYSREEKVLRFEQRQIWREMYSGLGPIVAKQLNQLAEARQTITDQQQKQLDHHPQLHPITHSNPGNINNTHRSSSNTTNSQRNLCAGTAIGKPIHLRINIKNARTNCYVPHVH
ncbi:hypothetical protein MKX03_004656 [Papaver bracteatum]|nr:hypothetical protein MKX03_004656 [Papaver bracteatum]